MKVIELENGNVYSEVDVSFMELDKMNSITLDLQSELFKLGKEKRKLNSIPMCKRDSKFTKRINRITDRLTDISEALAWIGSYKKKKRDTMQRELSWYKAYYHNSIELLGNRHVNKVTKATVEKLKYSIN